MFPDDELNGGEAIVGHAQGQMNELHKVVSAGRGGVSRRVAVPFTDVADDASGATGGLGDRLR